jgi:predicted DNA-binding transcriptional regulator AlpA
MDRRGRQCLRTVEEYEPDDDQVLDVDEVPNPGGSEAGDTVAAVEPASAPDYYSQSEGGRMLTVPELARRWTTTAQVIYNLRHRGEGPPAIRIGRELRFRLEDVERWEQSRLETPTPAAGPAHATEPPRDHLD